MIPKKLLFESVQKNVVAALEEDLGPEDIAKTVLFLLDGPRGITGEIITVDGGWTTRV